MSDLVTDLKATIRDIPDFPKPGIVFKDITPILSDANLFKRTIRHFARVYQDREITAIVGMESRGFLFGAPLALELGVPFVPARKPGKLPYEVVAFEYELEYGTNTLEMHIDAVGSGDHVLIIDDLLATGGTAAATVRLIEQLGATVAGCAFAVELTFLEGRKALGTIPVESLVLY
jgi:adenine phosphoribosyltransferase